MIKQRKSNKLTPIFEPAPYIVIYSKGTLIKAKAKNSNLVVTRSISHFCGILKDADFPDTRFFLSNTFMSNTRLKLAKN